MRNKKKRKSKLFLLVCFPPRLPLSLFLFPFASAYLFHFFFTSAVPSSAAAFSPAFAPLFFGFLSSSSLRAASRLRAAAVSLLSTSPWRASTALTSEPM